MIDPFCGIIVYHDHFSLVEINGLPLSIARTETLRFTPIFTKFSEYSSTKNVMSDSSEPNFSYKSSIVLLEFTMNSSTLFSSSLIDSENLDIKFLSALLVRWANQTSVVTLICNSNDSLLITRKFYINKKKRKTDHINEKKNRNPFGQCPRLNP